MQDRIPLYPGRVVLTPVSGQANTYDMTRADQPTQEGTPLNKASLLKDATAALYGLGTDAVPDEVLSEIHGLIEDKSKIVVGSYSGDKSPRSAGGSGLTPYQSGQSISLGFKPKCVFVTTSWVKYNEGSAITYHTPVFCMFTETIPFKSLTNIGDVSFYATGEITDDGFIVGNCQIISGSIVYNALPFLNQLGTVYTYVAIK